LKADLASGRKGIGEISEKIFVSEDEQTEEVLLFFFYIFPRGGEGGGCSFCHVFARVDTNISQSFNRMRSVRAVKVRKGKGKFLPAP
jgi:hypothetical protein